MKQFFLTVKSASHQPDTNCLHQLLPYLLRFAIPGKTAPHLASRHLVRVNPGVVAAKEHNYSAVFWGAQTESGPISLKNACGNGFSPASD